MPGTSVQALTMRGNDARRYPHGFPYGASGFDQSQSKIEVVPSGVAFAMRAASLVLTCLTVGAAAWAGAGSSARADDADRNLALRAAQIGALNDVSGAADAARLVKQIETIESTGPNRTRLSGVSATPKFTGGVAVSGFPEVVKIKFTESDGADNFCSGILLAGKDIPPERDAPNGFVPVLTAGHCSCGQQNSYRVVRGSVEAQKQEFLPVTQMSRYFGYSCLLPPEDQGGRDLALLWIRDPKSDPTDLYPALALPLVATMHQVYQDGATRRLVGVGYGLTETSARPAITLAAVIPIQSFFCSAGYYAASACASFREFVLADPGAAPGANRSDSCGGDSGSPIFWVPPSPAGVIDVKSAPRRFLVGITSRALAGVSHNPGTTCGGGGIYTVVGHPDVILWLSAQGIFVRTKLEIEPEAKR